MRGTGNNWHRGNGNFQINMSSPALEPMTPIIFCLTLGASPTRSLLISQSGLAIPSLLLVQAPQERTLAIL